MMMSEIEYQFRIATIFHSDKTLDTKGLTTMIRRQFLAFSALALIALTSANAADKNFTGKWLYTWERQGMKVETTFDLKQDGDKVTGTVSGMGGMKTEIKDGAVKDGQLTVKVVRERNGNTFSSDYAGKLEGDSFKGKISMEIMGEKREREFDAKRAS